MPLPSDKRMKFFVYVVESPSPVDFYNNRHEGALIAHAIGLDNIPCVVRMAISREAFEAAIKHGLPQSMKLFPSLLPVLHLSAHGSKEGIQLSNGEIISWRDLKAVLLPVNMALNGCLLLCMSSCDGISASSMALQQEEITRSLLWLATSVSQCGRTLRLHTQASIT